MFNATFNNVSVVIVERKVLRYQKWQKRTKGQTDLQNTTQKTKDRATRTPLKTEGESKLRSSNTNTTKNRR